MWGRVDGVLGKGEEGVAKLEEGGDDGMSLTDEDGLSRLWNRGHPGCRGSWDHHEILSVVPEYNSSNKCSTSARLRSMAPYCGRKETAVYASNLQLGL
ncbi:hypothetical protein Fmac_026413 [Flemingia macrophylla]|uniref:Uncharacterized protein n=1 Tax=Flemingia macrophylla TaxID=520843 RepID=A0ABD1LET3_9FABA